MKHDLRQELCIPAQVSKYQTFKSEFRCHSKIRLLSLILNHFCHIIFGHKKLSINIFGHPVFRSLLWIIIDSNFANKFHHTYRSRCSSKITKKTNSFFSLWFDWKWSTQNRYVIHITNVSNWSIAKRHTTVTQNITFAFI